LVDVRLAAACWPVPKISGNRGNRFKLQHLLENIPKY
jgi:hypothetical protein